MFCLHYIESDKREWLRPYISETPEIGVDMNIYC